MNKVLSIDYKPEEDRVVYNKKCDKKAKLLINDEIKKNKLKKSIISKGKIKSSKVKESKVERK